MVCPAGPDSDSDSELSLDEQSSSYASSASSDSEDDRAESGDRQGPVHSTPKGEHPESWHRRGGGRRRGWGPAEGPSCTPVDIVATNHVATSWPDESLGGSDSEEPGGENHGLKVETRLSVELHPESGAPPRPPEQRKGTAQTPD